MPKATLDILRQAVEAHGLGELDQARRLYLRHLARNPGHAKAWHLLALAGLQAGELVQAKEHCQRALDIQADFAQAHSLLGLILQRLGQPAEAVRSLELALRLAPDDADILNALGAASCEAGNFRRAASAHQRALELFPDSVEALSGLGNALAGLGRREEALGLQRRAVDLAPDDANARNNLGALLSGLGRSAEAAAEFRRAVELEPDFAQAHDNLGNALRESGDDAAANQAYAQAARLSGAPGSALKLALFTPLISRDADEIAATRAGISQALDELLENPPRLCDPYREVGQTNFYLAYHGQNDLALQLKTARLYLKACPELDYRAKPGPPKDGPLRLGLVSAFFQNHTIGKLNQGLIKNIDKSRFRLTLFKAPGRRDALAAELEAAAQAVVPLPDDLFAARREIERHPQDILYYPDIGMHALTYFLAFARLARLQCVSWGHPVSTGLPNLDYFLSSRLLEPASAASQYSERLVRLENFNAFAARPRLSGPLAGRERLGLPARARLYVCAQSPCKLHPDFDAVLAGILRQDPKGLIVLLRGEHPLIARRLLARICRGRDELAGRLIFLPPLAHADYLSLLGAADVLLDTVHFGGGFSTLEALALGAPVVTLPGEFLRSRISQAIYRKMEFNELVARDAEHYLELALRAARDADYAVYLRESIAGRNGALFDDPAPLRETEDFLEAALAAQPEL